MPDYVRLNEEHVGSETDSFTEERYAQFHKHMVGCGKRVLDIGCNTGRGGRVLKALDPSIQLTGLDCVPTRLAQLGAEVYEGTICSFTSKIEAPDESFDVIVAGEFIEHLEESDVDPTLRECLRLLRPGGQLMLTTPNPDYIRFKLTGHSVVGGAHLSQHYPHELISRMRRLGYDSLKVIPSGKVTRYLGERFPLLAAYGSYLAIGRRPQNS